MLLKTVFVRFYKSFNFDYLRKHHRNAQAKPWEYLGSLWYPYVRIPIESKVTTVVGANESGKSHLLSAIEKGISGRGIEREDFCRYSQFFTVNAGKMLWPDFGFEWHGLSDNEKQKLRTYFGLQARIQFDRCFIFRANNSHLTMYVPKEDNSYSRFELKQEYGTDLAGLMPAAFQIDSKIALPESVPIRFLAEDATPQADIQFERLERDSRIQVLRALEALNLGWFADPTTVVQSAPQIAPTMQTILNGLQQDSFNTVRKDIIASRKLAHDLMRKVAKIDPAAFGELLRAIKGGREGYVNGIIQQINNSLATSLNFPQVWVQDKDFALTVSPREHDLVFTIRDRTGTEYSFNERSSGLRFFLSYYIQYLAHESRPDGSEILLMDEPDAYLSSQAQQDLLRIFEAFATPNPSRAPVQVVYVTHSPFLIDKNHAERIRVLEKGVGDEGTRVVRDAAKNHYEPLRSAFGSFLGETAFIGNCNLMVEGIADQILLAGLASHLRSRGASSLETLDLNNITIVPTGSASHIPYMVYLARGRDIEKPAVIVLLDSDKSGDEARARLQRGPNRRTLLKNDHILQLGEIVADLNRSDGVNRTDRVIEIEDLVPLPILLSAARKYIIEICDGSEEDSESLTLDSLEAQRTGDRSAFDALEACFATAPSGAYHIDKVGLARLIIDVVRNSTKDSQREENPQEFQEFERRMKILFRRLQSMQRSAMREVATERISRRVDRAKNSFLRDHPERAKREDALLLFEELESTLDNSKESDAVSSELKQLRRDFELETNIGDSIADYERFRNRLEAVSYAGRIASQEPE
jgi:predicted ATPase